MSGHSSALKAIGERLDVALPELQKIIAAFPYRSEDYDSGMKALEAVAFARGLCTGFGDLAHYQEHGTFEANYPAEIAREEIREMVITRAEAKS